MSCIVARQTLEKDESNRTHKNQVYVYIYKPQAKRWEHFKENYIKSFAWKMLSVENQLFSFISM